MKPYSDYQGLHGGAIGLSDCGNRYRRGRRRRKGRLVDDLETGLTNQLRDSGGVEPGGVVFHAQSAGVAIKGETADAVDLAGGGESKGHSLSGRRGISKENFHHGHKEMITSGGRWLETKNASAGKQPGVNQK